MSDRLKSLLSALDALVGEEREIRTPDSVSTGTYRGDAPGFGVPTAIPAIIGKLAVGQTDEIGISLNQICDLTIEVSNKSNEFKQMQRACQSLVDLASLMEPLDFFELVRITCEEEIDRRHKEAHPDESY